MPPYAFLAEKELDYRDIEQRLVALRRVGVPYSPHAIENAKEDLQAQVDPFASPAGLKKRYGAKVQQRDFDGDPEKLSEMDALIAYLQMTGTLVDFRTYKATSPENLR
jgi:cytochrome c oxidase cbb3-type subunit 2